jgi:ketosteroid isomerase-like protein
MNYKKYAITLTLILFMGSFAMSQEFDYEAERAAVEKAIHDNIEWAVPEKDFDRMYSTIAKDSSFFIFHPDSKSTIVGYEAFQKLVKDLFMNPDLRPTGSDIRDMRITLSRSGDVAWYSCILDDYGEWKGQPYAWKNTRWTGVLEKRDGKWLIVQMHFSFASDAQAEADSADSTSGD